IFNQLLSDLRSRQEGGETLLERTMVLYGTNMGDANKHLTTNLPAILAGGGFKHGQHIGFDRDRNYPLTNLFVSILQRFGIDVDKFSSGSGTMHGLEMALEHFLQKHPADDSALLRAESSQMTGRRPVHTENSILAMKSPFSDDAAPTSSSN